MASLSPRWAASSSARSRSASATSTVSRLSAIHLPNICSGSRPLPDRDVGRLRCTAAQDGERHRRADAVGAEPADDVARAFDGIAIPSGDDVAEMQAGALGRAAIIKAHDDRAPHLLVAYGMQAGAEIAAADATFRG